MKLIFIVALFLCISAVFGIKCVYSGDGSSETNQGCSSKYCFTAHITGNYQGGRVSRTYQGCGNEVDSYVGEYHAKTCDENGNGYQRKNKDQLHAELYCCDTDFCNSATTYSLLGITTFIVFLKLFYV